MALTAISSKITRSCELVRALLVIATKNPKMALPSFSGSDDCAIYKHAAASDAFPETTATEGVYIMRQARRMASRNAAS